MRTITDWMLNKVCGWIETTHRAEEVHARLLKTFSRLSSVVAKNKALLSVGRDLVRAQEVLAARARQCPWFVSEAKIGTVFAEESLEETSLAQAGEWLRELPEGKLIRQRIVQRDAGAMLELLETGAPELKVELQVHLERLLRHVEVDREGCLATFSPVTSEQEKSLERLDVAILFSRHARRENDVRYLNAALKLNDWFGMSGCRSRDAVIAARSVLSLAEQEASLSDFEASICGDAPCVLPFSLPSKTAYTRAS